MPLPCLTTTILLLTLLTITASTTSTAPIHWHGQQLQDQILIEEIYKNQLTNGYFIELGAADGILISNTLALEQIGWDGICIEPSLAYKQLSTSGRKCIKRGDVVNGRNGDVVEFMDQADDTITNNNTDYGDVGGIRAPSSPEGLYSGILANMSTYNVHGRLSRRVTRTLADILMESKAPRHIDFLSLDTEGSELDILSTFPFHQYTFGAILVEHNHDAYRRRDLQMLLERNGYVRVRCIETDDLYVSLRVLAHYNVRVDPRECMSIPITIICSDKLNSKQGRKDCVTNGGTPDPFPIFVDVAPWQEHDKKIFQNSVPQVCFQLLQVCDRYQGWNKGAGGAGERDQSYSVPVISDQLGPKIGLSINGDQIHHIFGTSGSIMNASESINLQQLCQENLKVMFHSKECINMGNQLELFVDNWLKNETRKSVDRVMKSMIYEWTEASHVEALQDE